MPTTMFWWYSGRNLITDNKGFETTVIPTPITKSFPVFSITLIEIKSIVSDQKIVSIIGVYYPVGDPNFPSGMRHIFRLKMEKDLITLQ